MKLLFPYQKVSRLLPCSLAAAAILFAAGTGWAQLEISSPPNFVGSGARALGMGGAFIAVADDATAASWNPGGLTQLERPEASVVYGWKFYHDEFSSGQKYRSHGADEIDFGELNYLSIVYPFRRTIAGRNLVLSLNYQRKFNFDRDLEGTLSELGTFLVGTPFLQRQSRLTFEQRGSLGAISPAFGFELTDRLSIGVVANIWNQSLVPTNEWEKTIRQDFWSTFGAVLSAGRIVEKHFYEDFEGVNYTFGVLYKPTERLSIGAVYHTKFAADVKYTLRRVSITFPPSAARRTEERRIEFPSALGVGVAYRFPNDKLTVSLDVTRRDWDEFVEIQRGAFGQPRRISPITSLPKYRSYHEPTYTVRVGGEYVFFNPNKPLPNYLFSLRGGAMYDPEPSGGRKVNFLGLGKVTGEPDDFWGVTLGGGVLIKNRVNVDFAYQYRWGDNVRKDTYGLWDVDADVDQHEVYLSTVIYFF